MPVLVTTDEVANELARGSVAAAPDLLYLCPTNEPGDVPLGVLPAPIGGDGPDALDFSDVLQVCDVVVGKMGYGLVAECIASGVALLWRAPVGPISISYAYPLRSEDGDEIERLQFTFGGAF